MTLKTLGGLKLEGNDFQRSKALLLLTYLALEGEKDRQFMAELFWQGSSKPLHNLNMTLTRLRKADETLIESNEVSISSSVKLDVLELEAADKANDYEKVLELYKKPFLEGISSKDLGNELEEWIFEKREYFAGLVQEANLQLAESKARQAKFKEATEQAAETYHLRYAPEPDEKVLERIFMLLQTDSHKLSSEVRKEALSYGLELGLSQNEARERFANVEQTASIHNLPDYLSSFIGRREELNTLSDYLAEPEKRLISLVGLGGMGKTRLALEVARKQIQKNVFADGVYFVALDALKDSQSIPYEIADAMKLSLRGDRPPLELLIKQLATKQLLLVLDNYEHLIEAAPLCNELLSQCPNVKLLVTSRERLNVDGEWVYPLQGLSKGQRNEAESLIHTKVSGKQDEASYQDAISLFEQRAQQANPQFTLDDLNQEATASICQLVEGSPLAIELAASWVKLLSPVEIAQEIQQNLELLSSKSRTIHSRHQSIEAAFEYSWKMLSEKEQAVLRKLSVFEGGFSREAASTIAKANLGDLSSLVDKSLVRVSGEKRFDLHPLIKQFSASKLALLEQEKQQTQEKHAQFFATIIESIFFIRTQVHARQTSSELATLENLSNDYENALASWDWYLLHQFEQDISNISFGLAILIGFNVRYREGAVIFQNAENHLRKLEIFHTSCLASIICHKSWCLMEQGKFQYAFEEMKNAIDLLATEAPHYAHWFAYNASCNFNRKVGLFKRGKAHALKAIEYAKLLNLEQQLMWSKGELGILLFNLGDYPEFHSIVMENYSYHNQVGASYQASMNLIYQGELHLATRNYDQARVALSESLKRLNVPRKTTALMRCLNMNARLELETGNIEIASQLAYEAVELARHFGAKYYEARALTTLGSIALAKSDFDSSNKHLMTAIHLAYSHMAYSTQLTALNFLAELKVKQEHYDVAYLWLALVSKHDSAEFWVKEKAQESLDELQKNKTKALNTITPVNLTLEQVVLELI